MRNWHNFLFYCFYILDRLIKPQWWSEQKAAFWVCVVDFWIILTIYGYINLLFDNGVLDKEAENIAVYICMSVLLSFNWYLFLKDNKFKKIISKYDKESKNGGNKKKYYLIVLTLALILLLMSFMFYFTGKASGTIK